jgi:uncharacterized protein YndB with AHSA1/START domain
MEQPELVIRRVISAPRTLVFDAWSDPEHIGMWWGPNGFRTTTHSMDMKVGGRWRYTMHGPDGTDYENLITYTEIVRPERLAYDHGDDQDPDIFKAVITFDDANGKTALTLRMICKSALQLEGMKKFGAVEGGQQTLERLERYITSMEKK